MAYKDRLASLIELVKQSEKVTFLTGAGFSTCAGVKDFRGKDGLYNDAAIKQKYYGYSPEELLSIDAFKKYTETVCAFYREFFLDEIKPGRSHILLKQMQDMGIVQHIITQNIDNLHQLAGSKMVHDLHGNMKDFYCMECGEKYTLDDFRKHGHNVMRCSVEGCSGLVRPDIVMYGEYLDQNVANRSYNASANADLLIVAGTGLNVPTAGMIVECHCAEKLVIINNTPTPGDRYANILFKEDLVQVLEDLMEGLKDEV